MNVGDYVKITDQDGDWDVEITEIRSTGVYGTSIRGKYVEPQTEQQYGLWPLSMIKAIVPIPKPFEPVDGIKITYPKFDTTYIRSGGTWYKATAYTDTMVENDIKQGIAEVVE